MAVENNARLMKVRQILFEETDENNHDLSIFEIIERLTDIFPDATFDKRTIKSDIELLDAMDFEIIRNKGERGKILYSHQSRIFETYQLRLIIDAILSAKFITDKEKNNLIEKIKKLTSKYIAKSLPNPVVFDVDIREMGDDSFLLTTKAKLSDGLINWILTWGNKAKILASEY